MNPSVVIIGGGPAGASAGRLLASWGYRVVLFNRPVSGADAARGLAESLPPTTRKLLAEIGVLTAVERAGFYRSTGNTVWWASRERRVESFGSGADALGFQVLRPDLDGVLLAEAAAAGVDVRAAHVRSVTFDDAGGRVTYEENGQHETLSCRFVLDCSGRAGVVARRFRRPGLRTYALVGEWHADGWELPDPTHTVVEAYDRGWAWSVPVSATIRHAGLMIDGASPRGGDGRALVDAYRAELAKTTALARVVGRATLARAWACDASTYSSEHYATPQLLLVGDAGSFIDPLSSFGVKKALASAWVAAIAVNTCLAHPEREAAALDFFSTWERDVCASHARRARDFAVDAVATHPHPFWAGRASAAVDGEDAARWPGAARPDMTAALNLIRDSDALDLALDDRVTFEPRPVIRGREIVLEDALTLPPGAGHDTLGPRVRFVDNVDLVALAQLAGRHRHVPDLFEAYCRTSGPAPLPNVIGGLSLLVAAGVLRQRNMMQF